MNNKKVKLSIGYFPPYDKYYVSADSHIDDYLSGDHIHRLYPSYFSTREGAEKARDEYIKKHPDEAEVG